MAKASCPPIGDWQSLATGDLPSPAMEPLLEHLESCEICFRQVKTLAVSDTLLEVLAKAKTVSQGPDPEMSRA